MPPTLDRVRWETLASYAGVLAGVASRRMKFHGRFVANRAVRMDLVIVSTRTLAPLSRLLDFPKPVRVQTSGSELAVQAFNERIVGWLPKPREIKGGTADKRPKV